MNELNQNQMILLVLLITFVTSIATGIMTVSLLQEAPVEVTRNINRIVEKTIETVVPVDVGKGNTEKEVTTVVVKEDDLIVSSVNNNIRSIVRIEEQDTLGTKNFYGLGVVIAKDGTLITDRKTITSQNIYYAKFSDDTEHKIVPLGVDKNTGSILFKVNLPEKTKYDFYPVKISVSDTQLGQTIISIGGESENVVVVGRVSSLVMRESTTASTTVKFLSSIETDMIPKDLVQGSPIFNLSGELVGIKLSTGLSSFTPISIINREIKTILN